MKTALITGVAGQDGRFLAKLLLDKGYRVVGVRRRASGGVPDGLLSLLQNPQFECVEGDVTDAHSVHAVLEKHLPDEVYNLAAQSVTEDCLCPIKYSQRVDYVSLGKLWRDQSRKNKIVRVEKFGDTEVEVIDLPENTPISALGMWNGMGTWFKVKQISRHRYKGKVAKLTQKFGSVTVTPNHSLLDTQGRECRPADNPWMLSVRKINYRPNQWLRRVEAKVLGVCHRNDDWVWLNEGGKVGRVRRQLTGDRLTAFCRFAAAFAAEGHTTHNKLTGAYTVCISQQDKSWLEGLADDARTFVDANICFVRHDQGEFQPVWRLEIKSRALYSLMRKWCGGPSSQKCLPPWFVRLDDDHRRQMWEKLLDGDGCRGPLGWRYTTTSYRLACQLSWLVTSLGYDYTVHHVRVADVDKANHDQWHFRECQTYTPTQGEDGKKVDWLDYDGWVYDISVAEVSNFTVGVGNIVVHNSHVATSFDQPIYTAQADYLGVLHVLEWLRERRKKGFVHRFYQASTSEMFGSNCNWRDVPTPGTMFPELYFPHVGDAGDKYLKHRVASGNVLAWQDENTPFSPNSPYAIAKLAAHHACRLYREAYGVFASCGILYNHESELRGPEFVTRKITKHLAAQKVHGFLGPLKLGNLDAQRDWGYAGDYVRGMWMMLRQDQPADYVLATGETHSVREFVAEAMRHVGLDPADMMDYVEVDPAFVRPQEVPYLRGRADKARRELGWAPEVNFSELVRLMVEHDVKQEGRR